MRNGRWLVWLKAIGGALVAVLLVKTLFVTSCFIPSSGMENSLYQGEGVLVGKWSYGLRLPFPSLLGYHRLGASPVERGDIVLFNNPNPADPETGIEWREVFISRCVGLPGDTLSLNRALTVTGNQALSPDSKALYVYPSSSEDLMQAVLETLELLPGNTLVSYTSDGGYVRSFSHYEFYLVSQKLEGRIPVVPLDSRISQETHPFVVPRKQVPVKVYPWNAVLLCNTIVRHEHKQAGVQGDTLYVEGRPVGEYTFSKDYYWMASNDPVNLSDSRLFGFVPEDHLIGRALRIWYPARKGRFLQRVQ